MPLTIFADDGPAEKDFERTENVNSDSIISQTLTILVQRTSDSGNKFTVPICWEKIKVGQMFSFTYIVSLLVSISMDKQLYFLAKIVIFCIKYIGK